MKNNFTLKVLIGFIPFVLSSCLAYGQADSSKLEMLTLRDLLNVKVVTASKTSQSMGLAPATVMVITKEQIRLRGYQSLLDVMYDLPDVKVDDKIYSGIRNSFTVRGTQGSDKFVIMLDGVTISSPSGEAMPIMENYPVNLAEQIEVVYGPASALYGANAVSGVINIITKNVSSQKIRVEGSITGGNFGYSNQSLFVAKKLNDHISFIVSGQYSYDKGVDYSEYYKNDSFLNVASYSTGQYNTVYGPVSPTTPVRPHYEAPIHGYNVYSALHIDEFSLSFFRNYTKTPAAWGSNTRNTIYNRDVFMAQSVSVVNAAYKKAFNRVTSATSLTMSQYNLNPNSSYRNLYTAMEPAYKYSTCSMIKAEEQLDYKVSDKLKLFAGAAYETYSAIPQSADLDAKVNVKDYIHSSYAGTRAYYRPNGLEAQFYFIKYHNIGGYFQTQYSPSQKVHITAGLRYDVNSRYGSSINPRAGFVYKPSEKTIVKMMYGSAFLAPTPSDSYAQYGSFDTPDSGRTYHSSFLHLSNPNLKPIRSQNIELSIQQYFTDNFSVTLDGYYTALSGLHEFADDNTETHLYNNTFNSIPVDYIEVFINEEKQKNYGGSLRLNWKHTINNTRFNTYASLSYVDGVVTDPGVTGSEQKRTQIDFISPFMFRFGTDIKGGKLSGSARLTVLGRQRIAGISDNSSRIAKLQTIPGYALLNLSVRYTITPKLSVFANVSNALNQHYRSVAFNMDKTKETDVFIGQPEDPIRFMTGLSFNF